MKVEIKELDGLKRQVSVQIPSEEVESEMTKKFAEVRAQAKIDGYRPGKAPMDRIKSMFGDEVRSDVAEELIRISYPEVIRQQSLKVASYPTVTEADYIEEGGFGYTAVVEVYPEIGKVAYDNLEVTVQEVEVSDADVDEFVEGLLKRFAEYRVLEREAGQEDVVVADLKKLHDPSLVLPGDSFEDQEIDLGNPVTVREFREQLIGAKASDELDIEVNYPKDYPDAAFAGATVKYNCRVKAVKERILPEFDDAFAKRTGQAETALELRLQIREQLKLRLVDAQNRSKRNQLIGQVSQQNELPIPEGLVDEYLTNVIEDFKKRQGEDKVDETEIRKSYHDMGIRTIRWNLLYNQLVDQENIEVLPADIEERIQKFADNYKMSMEKAKEALNSSGSIADIQSSILEEKVLDFLVDKAKVITQEKQTTKA
ncbi:MAG: trigger factor [candidate division Zixibacteria bacterium]|nr:trigger factor [candidate division Zixibacteria bacterium]MDH3937001.1 trigger factor [candidate division Zixibacteria bacterium]MDH4034580.1 trigger factor [candidate division Zixibacteria bacterium]